MVIFPGSKINIGLNIVEKRADGFHNLESIFYPIPLSDILEIVKSDSFSFRSTGLSIDGDISDNLVYKAYQLLQKRFNLSPVKIALHKVVPMGAGLGGGSADAAAMLILLNDLFNLNIATKELCDFADKLGSDCSFFIENKPAFVQGKGELLSSTTLDLSSYYIHLVNPNIHINTKTAFSGISIKKSQQQLERLTEKEITNWKKIVYNDFESTIFPNHQELSQIKTKLYTRGALYSSMTGTGSTVYGIFKEKPQVLFPEYFEWTSKLN